MPNQIDIYQPRYLAEVVRSAPPVHTFLRDTFFTNVKTFDTGLYNRHIILYIRVEDYGPKPKQGKLLTLDKKLTYLIQKCDEESGVYRMTMERTRQG